MRLPPTNIKKPINSTNMANGSVNSHLKLGLFCPNVTVINIPTIQTKTVLLTSPIDLANAFIYLVTVTPQILNVAIENTPIMTKKSKKPLENIYEK